MGILSESQGAVVFFPHDLGDIKFCHESGQCCVGSVMFREPTILHAWSGVFVRNEEVELTTAIFRKQTAKYLNNKNGDAIVILFLIASECVACTVFLNMFRQPQ